MALSLFKRPGSTWANCKKSKWRTTQCNAVIRRAIYKRATIVLFTGRVLPFWNGRLVSVLDCLGKYILSASITFLAAATLLKMRDDFGNARYRNGICYRFISTLYQKKVALAPLFKSNIFDNFWYRKSGF